MLFSATFRTTPNNNKSGAYRYKMVLSATKPIIGKNYGQIIPEIATPIKGVFLANTTQIYPEDRGTNYSVKMAKKVVNLIDIYFKEDL